MARTDNVNNKISHRRAVALSVLMLAVFGLYSLRLFQVQIVEGDEYASISNGQYSRNMTISASRGEILDRYLRPIAVNRTSLSVVFDYDFFPRGTAAEQRQLQNEIILSLTSLLKTAGEEWNDSLPITGDGPYAFEEGREGSVNTLKRTILNVADYATADDCMKWLVKRYCLEGYSTKDQRTAAGVQYEMEIRQFSAANPFTFSGDISENTSYVILENNRDYPGVDIQTVPVREYVAGDTGAHLIGQVTPIYEDEYKDLKEKGYKLNDSIGRGGIEGAMEDELRGDTGTTTVVKNARGQILDKYESKAPVPGNSVVLTLDLELQATAQQALADKIKALRAQAVPSGTYKGQDVRSGSAVLLDVSNGGVLVSASWPSYDLSTYNEDYAKLLADPDRPLFNRALNGTFPCGSTMKPCVAMAALMEGTITPSSHPVFCNRYYTYYEGYTYKCLGYHGSVNVVDALAKSCNVFFYDVGRLLKIGPMNEYAAQFGLGQKTGIEIGEAQGVLAGPAEREANGGKWLGGDTIQAAIGQSDNLFSPIQLAAYAMTLANDGVRYKTHLVQAVRSYDGRETPVGKEVLVRMQLSKEAIDTVRAGMVKVVTSGTASARFRGIDYTVAAKTGTAQVSNTRSDHGVFIAYAPVEKPEVALAVLMEDGTSGAAAEVARVILDAYFDSKTEGSAPTPEEELLP